MKISTNKYVVVDNGTIVLPDNEQLEFEIEGLRFRFTFLEDLSDDSKGKTRITGALVSDDGSQYMSIDIINFDSLFATPNQMIEMGKINGKKLFLNFSIITLSNKNDDKTRVFHYTWYTLKEQNDGTTTEK